MDVKEEEMLPTGSASEDPQPATTDQQPSTDRQTPPAEQSAAADAATSPEQTQSHLPFLNPSFSLPKNSKYEETLGTTCCQLPPQQQTFGLLGYNIRYNGNRWRVEQKQKLVDYLHYGPFASHAPVYDSNFADVDFAEEQAMSEIFMDRMFEPAGKQGSELEMLEPTDDISVELNKNTDCLRRLIELQEGRLQTSSECPQLPNENEIKLAGDVLDNLTKMVACVAPEDVLSTVASPSSLMP